MVLVEECSVGRERFIPSLDRYVQYLRKFIVKDETTMKLVFLTALSAYTNNPINLFLKGPSSVGKTYITTTVVKLFPPEDVWLLGGLSPKALIHLHSQLVDENLEPIYLEEKPGKDASLEEVQEWKERLRRARYLVDLSRKILVFLEAPSLETFMMLRPILSHDEYKMEYKYVDEKLRTRSVILRGWPATIFCSTAERYVEELATRSITCSPVEDEEKYKQANVVTARGYTQPSQVDFEGGGLRDYIKHLRELMNVKVMIPYAEKLASQYPARQARAMRDFKMLLRMIQTLAAFNLFRRVTLVFEKNGMEVDRYIVANLQDAETALELFMSAWETTLTGLPEGVLDFYYQGCLPAAGDPPVGFSSSDAIARYRSIRKKDISYRTAVRYLSSLVDVGYLDEEPDPSDRRKKLYYPRKKPEDTANYCQALISSLFSPEELRMWLDQIVPPSQPEPNGPTRVKIIDNFLQREISVEDFCILYLAGLGVTIQSETDLKSNGENEAQK